MRAPTCLSVTVAGLLVLASTAAFSQVSDGLPLEMVHNDNFVVSAATVELAQAVLDRAEELRDEIAMEWLGQPIPPSLGTTVISVRICESEDSGQTWPGANLNRPTYMMWLRAPQDQVTGPLLAHEMTHVVLSTRYPGLLPAWVNEGIASLRDDEERKSTRKYILTWFAETGNWPHIGEVFDAEKIMSTDQFSYTIAGSVVEYLLTKEDKATLLRLAVEGRKGDWDAAIRQNYAIGGLRQLQLQWQAWVADSLYTAAQAGNRARSVTVNTRPTIGEQIP